MSDLDVGVMIGIGVTLAAHVLWWAFRRLAIEWDLLPSERPSGAIVSATPLRRAGWDRSHDLASHRRRGTRGGRA